MYGVIYFTGQRIARLQMADIEKREKIEVHCSVTFRYLTLSKFCLYPPVEPLAINAQKHDNRATHTHALTRTGSQEDQLGQEPRKHRAYAMGQHPAQGTAGAVDM
jgi:hypothetical protein